MPPGAAWQEKTLAGGDGTGWRGRSRKGMTWLEDAPSRERMMGNWRKSRRKSRR